MDQARFDAIARALAGSASRRSALAALAGIAAVGLDGEGIAAKSRRRRCRKDSPPGQCCRKRDGVVSCACKDGGTPCGDDCCAADERCEAGACVPIPPEPACIPAGEPCKGMGRPCCDGRDCASGQGGLDDVACYAPAGGACERTSDCSYGSACEGGTCVAQCTPVQARCGKVCTDLTADPVNCGACGDRCLVNETCADGDCACGDYEPTLENTTCCPNGEGWMKAVAGAFQCAAATEASDCYQGWKCCAGRCVMNDVSCAACSADGDCADPNERCCDGRCQSASPDAPGCLRGWAYAMPDRCGFVQGEPCPEGFSACEGKNSDTFPSSEEAPGWVCCPRGTTCVRERGVCVQG